MTDPTPPRPADAAATDEAAFKAWNNSPAAAQRQGLQSGPTNEKWVRYGRAAFLAGRQSPASPDREALREGLTTLIGEFYASDIGRNCYTDADMATWLAERLPLPPVPSEEQVEAVAGWVFVPKEPTREMIRAGCVAAKWGSGHWGAKYPDAEIWAAMIAAAPNPPTGEG